MGGAKVSTQRLFFALASAGARGRRLGLGGAGGIGGGFAMAFHLILLGLVLEALQCREANAAAHQQSELPIHPRQPRGIHHADRGKGG